jgi:hypothetical protein
VVVIALIAFSVVFVVAFGVVVHRQAFVVTPSTTPR